LQSQQQDDQDKEFAANFDHQVRSIVSEFILDPKQSTSVYVRALEKFERPLLEEILDQAQGNQIKAAKMLGINRNTLRKKLTEYEIDPSQRK
jgi:DNA-binding protein Fis